MIGVGGIGSIEGSLTVISDLDDPDVGYRIAVERVRSAHGSIAGINDLETQTPTRGALFIFEISSFPLIEQALDQCAGGEKWHELRGKMLKQSIFGHRPSV